MTGESEDIARTLMINSCFGDSEVKATSDQRLCLALRWVSRPLMDLFMSALFAAIWSDKTSTLNQHLITVNSVSVGQQLFENTIPSKEDLLSTIKK